jgi:hypothetical protein
VSTLNEDLRRLDELKADEAEKKRAANQAAEQRALWEKHCFDRMVDEQYDPGESSVKIKGVVYIPNRTDYAAVQDRDAFIEWAKENDAGLIEVAHREGLLNQLVRERLDNGEPLPPGIGFYTKEFISIRGGAATKHRRKPRASEQVAVEWVEDE